MRTCAGLTCVLAFASSLVAQSTPLPDVVSIARTATKASVLIVTSDASGKPLSQGSGFIASKNGLVITNFHVMKGAASAVAKFSDGAFYEVAGFIGADPSIDVAVLKLQASEKEFPFLGFADTDQVTIGQHVIALGSPMSLENTVSDGIVSAVRRAHDLDSKLKPDLQVFQTTAPVSPGSSGGPLLDMQGNVIGITSFGAITGQNLNFVIPIGYSKPLLGVNEVKPLTELGASERGDDAGKGISTLAGTYVGIWQSRLSGTGALALRVNVEDGVLKASVTITGSPSGYKGDTLAASNVKDMGDGVWSVDFNGEHSKLKATGIFKPGSFVGDFSFKYKALLRPDRGQWIARK